MIMEHPRGSVLMTDPLQAEVAQQAVELMANHNIQPVVHHINEGIEEIWTGHTQFDNEWSELYFSAFLEDTIRRMDYEAICNGRPNPLRVVAFASEKEIYDLIPEVSVLSCSWNAVRNGNYGCSELAVLAQECSKASGVTALASLLDIPLTQVMAIGDNHNDVEMLQAVGWGVAMGQAPEDVKAVAHAVTASNREDGLALAIERYALRC